MRVHIYRNLRKDCLSIRYKGRVIGYADSVLIDNPAFFVGKGRERVIATGVKNVHAYIIGELIVANGEKPDECGTPIMYNPKKFQTFVRQDHSGIAEAKLAYCNGKQIYIKE